MKKFTCHAATATVGKDQGGVVEVVFAGPLTKSSFESLRASAINEVGPHRVAVLRFDTALIVMNEVVPRRADENRPGQAGAAIIVRRDQYDLAWRYAALTANLGVTLCVFLNSPESVDLAWRWARRQVALVGSAR